MTINLPIELPDDFTFGNCQECPLSCEDYLWDEDGYYVSVTHCVLGRNYSECPLYGASHNMGESMTETEAIKILTEASFYECHEDCYKTPRDCENCELMQAQDLAIKALEEMRSRKGTEEYKQGRQDALDELLEALNTFSDENADKHYLNGIKTCREIIVRMCGADARSAVKGE